MCVCAGDQQKERLAAEKERFEPLTRWLGEKLGAWITRATVSRRLARSPAALAATAFGWTGNMERLAMSNAHQKADDAARKHHLQQKKLLEVNPRHPVVVELLRRVRDEPDAADTLRAAHTLYRTAALRSGYLLQEGQAVELADSVERMLQRELGLPADAAPDLDDIDDDDTDNADTAPADTVDADADHDEL